MTNPLPPAHWAADPSGGHEYRYWDGSRWTDHVSDRGAVSVDPIDRGVPTTPRPAVEVVVNPAPVVNPLPVNADGLLVPVVAAPPPPPPEAGIAYYPAADGLRLGRPLYWHPLDGLRTAIVALLACVGVAALASIATLVNRISAVHTFQDRPQFATAQDVLDADDAVSGAVAIWLLLFIATAVVFIIWQFRVAKNIEFLGRDRERFAPGWSIGAWFIPLANFVIPLLIFQDFWRATTPGTAPGSDWRDRRGSWLLGIWWAALLIGNMGRFSASSDDDIERFGSRTLDSVVTADTVAAVALAISVIAVVLAIMVVVQLTRRANARLADAGGAQR
ncbi:MAG: DUF4328 domain-containing protein [Acidimicrobiia bacterium]